MNGFVSWCLFCRKVVHSCRTGVDYYQGLNGEYYAHSACFDEALTQYMPSLWPRGQCPYKWKSAENAPAPIFRAADFLKVYRSLTVNKRSATV